VQQKSEYIFQEESNDDTMDKIIKFLCKHDDYILTFGVSGCIMGIFMFVCVWKVIF